MKKYFLLEICLEALTANCKTQEEVDSVIKNSLTEEFLIEQYSHLIKIIPEDIFENCFNRCAVVYQEDLEESDNYRKYIKNIWEKGFELSNALYSMTFEALSDFSNRLEKEHSDSLSENRYKCKVLQMLANKNLQTFSAVFCLIQNGYPDQSFMLFRNMLENMVCSKFIFDNNDETAKAFYELGFSSSSKSSNNKNNNRNYEWARKSGKFEGVKSITFWKLFCSCNFKQSYRETWDSQYKLACKLLHSTPQGTANSLSLYSFRKHEDAFVGVSPYGLNFAAEQSAMMLEETVRNFLCLFSDQTNQVIMYVLHKLVGKISEVYSEISEEFKNNE
jgi:hypothetical protein